MLAVNVLAQAIQATLGGGIDQKVAHLDADATKKAGILCDLELDRVAGHLGQRCPQTV